MPIERLGDVSTRLTDITERYSAAVVNISARRRPSRFELEDLRGELKALSTDTRELLRDMDAIDETDFAFVLDGARTIRLWIWRRETRGTILRFVGRIKKLSEIALALIDGSKDRVIITRQGDTWQSIALRELGDYKAWTKLLDANPEATVTGLQSGVAIIIPVEQ